MAATAPRPAPPEHLVVGHITKPHGTRGELFVWPLTDRPETVFEVGRRLLVGDSDGQLGPDAAEVRVVSSRAFKRGVLVGLEGLSGRDAAETLAGRYLLAPLSTLPEREEGEVFYHELLGLRVETVAGAAVGTVREVFEVAPADLLEVVASDGRVHLIPFAAHVVRNVDVAGGRLVIEPPAGLLEL
ncbi:MAG TPA: ribosome maturation factor RimM [Longimicrobiales bacterium]|nr:ribosome maturation factor RimM [Longimicrobiales bacterium]